jgi:hypothetical protein
VAQRNLTSSSICLGWSLSHLNFGTPVDRIKRTVAVGVQNEQRVTLEYAKFVLRSGGRGCFQSGGKSIQRNTGAIGLGIKVVSFVQVGSVGQIGFEVTSPTNSRQCGLQAKLNPSALLFFDAIQQTQTQTEAHAS